MFTWLATSTVKHFFLNLKQQLLLNIEGSLFTVTVKEEKLTKCTHTHCQKTIKSQN